MNAMKNILIYIGFGLIFSQQLLAQAPEKFSYQAVIRNAGGALVSNQTVGVRISVLFGLSNGTAVYVERHSVTTNSNGLLSLQVGDGETISGNFGQIDWSQGNYFIKTETDINGGNNYTISGTSQLLSVPYALHALSAASFSGQIEENDPIFQQSIAATISEDDISHWNEKLDSFTEADPLYASSVASSITANDIERWNGDQFIEVDPIFEASVAAIIVSSDISNWNNKLDSFTENDPVFGSSTAASITEEDLTNWNSKLDSYTEIDPLFAASVSAGINSSDTAKWNNKQETLSAGTGIEIDGNVISTNISITSYSVGDFAQGGVVFWVDETGQHGLVASIENQSAGVKWRGGATNYTVMARGNGIYAGKINTSIIIGAHAAKDDVDVHAAFLCNSYNGNDFGDWYLPSIRELELLYENQAIVNSVSVANGGEEIINSPYWSSTEGTATPSLHAQLINFYDGQLWELNKSHSDYRVRAIRAF